MPLNFGHSFPNEKTFQGRAFPLLVQPAPASVDSRKKCLCAWIADNKDDVDRLLKEHGALLFRGFLSSSHEDFDELVVASGYCGMSYVGGAAVRTQLTERVFTANESPSSENIPFHHEMAQVPSPPTHLFFFCETPAGEGGETPILESAEVVRRMESLHPQFMRELESSGVMYLRNMPEEDDPTSAIGRGWRSTFLTTTRDGAEAALRDLGSTWEWNSDGDTLKTITKQLPAIRYDAKTGTKNFFNSIVAAHTGKRLAAIPVLFKLCFSKCASLFCFCFTGWNDTRNVGKQAVLVNGKVCDNQAIEDAVKIMDEIACVFRWETGDVLLVDNNTVMHSRRPFVGPRRILASLVRDPER